MIFSCRLSDRGNYIDLFSALDHLKIFEEAMLRIEQGLDLGSWKLLRKFAKFYPLLHLTLLSNLAHKLQPAAWE